MRIPRGREGIERNCPTYRTAGPRAERAVQPEVGIELVNFACQTVVKQGGRRFRWRPEVEPAGNAKRPSIRVFAARENSDQTRATCSRSRWNETARRFSSLFQSLSEHERWQRRCGSSRREEISATNWREVPCWFGPAGAGIGHHMTPKARSAGRPNRSEASSRLAIDVAEIVGRDSEQVELHWSPGKASEETVNDE